MAQSKVEGLLATYAALTSTEKSEFRAMLAGWDMRGQRNEPTKKTAAPKKTAAKAEAGV